MSVAVTTRVIGYGIYDAMGAMGRHSYFHIVYEIIDKTGRD
jgi:hypothetical protein